MTARDMAASAMSRIERVAAVYDRATLAPTVVRSIVALAALAAFGLALPSRIVMSPVMIAFLLLAALPGLAPRGPLPTVVIVSISIGWLVNTGFDGTRITLWRLAALAILIYAIHAGAALAAVLPYDAVVSPGVFRPWLTRAALVAVATVGVALFVTAIPSFLGGSYRLVGATLAGFVLMVTIAIYLTYLGNRSQ